MRTFQCVACTVVPLVAVMLVLATWGCSELTPQSPRDTGVSTLADEPSDGQRARDHIGPHLVPGTGSYDVAVILVEPPGTAWELDSGPIDEVPYVDDIMFDASDDYAVADALDEMSFGQLTITGDVLGPIVLTDPGLHIDSLSCAYGIYSSAAAALADDPPYEYDLDAYDIRVYVYPPEMADDCSANGYGGGTTAHVFNVWDPGVYIHELGHVFGLGHAGTTDLNAITQSGQYSEYGDYSCFMSNNWIYPPGYAVPLHHANAPHKIRAGWIPGSHILDIDAAGTYTNREISPLEIDPAQCSHDGVIRVTHPETGDVYYLSYRYPASGTYDGNPYLRTVYQNGLTVDFFESVNIHSGGTYTSFFEAALDDDGTWVSGDGKVSVTQTDHDEYGVTVDVTVTCADYAPTVSIDPSINYGSPGTGLDVGNPYTVTVTNANDEERTYALSGTGQYFFDVAIASEVTVDANSSSQVTALLDFSQAGDQGAYSFTVTASDECDPTLADDVQGTYTIDTVAPTTPTGLSASSNDPVTLYWNASSDATSGVAKYKVFRGGAFIGETTTTSYIDNTTEDCTGYQYTVKAVDAAGNVSSASSPLSISTGGCGGGGCRGCPPPQQG